MKYFLPIIISFAFIQSVLASNPILEGADPHAILVDDTFYVYPTSGPRTKFYVYSSTDLSKWQQHPAILDFQKIDWIPSSKRAWAPAIIEKQGTWYFYYSVGPKPSHIGVASADSPTGPFTDSGKALLSDNNDPAFEAIDPMVFKDPKSKKYYLYAGGSAGSKLRVFELAQDMINFAKEIKVPSPEKFTEGAFMHERNGIYYLSYSHGGWQDSTYSIHYATSKSPIGPWKYKGPILTSNETYKGPGHHSFTYNPTTDQWQIFYHRWENVSGKGPYKGRRVTAIETFHYKSDGTIAPITMTKTKYLPKSPTP
jgi:beta-xylosidase